MGRGGAAWGPETCQRQVSRAVLARRSPPYLHSPDFPLSLSAPPHLCGLYVCRIAVWRSAYTAQHCPPPPPPPPDGRLSLEHRAAGSSQFHQFFERGQRQVEWMQIITHDPSTPTTTTSGRKHPAPPRPRAALLGRRARYIDIVIRLGSRGARAPHLRHEHVTRRCQTARDTGCCQASVTYP